MYVTQKTSTEYTGHEILVDLSGPGFPKPGRDEKVLVNPDSRPLRQEVGPLSKFSGSS